MLMVACRMAWMISSQICPQVLDHFQCRRIIAKKGDDSHTVRRLISMLESDLVNEIDSIPNPL